MELDAKAININSVIMSPFKHSTVNKKERVAAKKPEKNNKVERENSAFTTLIFLSTLALIVVFMFAECRTKVKGSIPKVSIFSILFFIAFASFLVGSLIGFLFGIPRTLQQADRRVEDGLITTSVPNTNLEQISDWLTKILVGVGLTQINDIRTGFQNLVTHSAKSLLPDISSDQGFAINSAVMIFFTIDGFLMTYLWTRLFLAKIQDETLIDDRIDEKLKNADLNDKFATSIAFNQLNLSESERDYSVEELLSAFQNASGNVINTIFFRAINVRQVWLTNKPEDKNKIARTIPIFEALIKLDRDLEFPENFAQLGLAFKDKENPDYSKALENLEEAFKGFLKRGNQKALDSLYYPRAFCRIMLDNEFKTNNKSIENNYNLIKKDIEEGDKEKNTSEMKDEQMKQIDEWKKLNV